mmetsp:Transcript_25585/g.60423  ORF Transcript_25585/g.60423 Transcript_25585/m.60423 type:complete len:423 (-) Transcript_25585:337-1605(-)
MVLGHVHGEQRLCRVWAREPRERGGAGELADPASNDREERREIVDADAREALTTYDDVLVVRHDAGGSVAELLHVHNLPRRPRRRHHLRPASPAQLPDEAGGDEHRRGLSDGERNDGGDGDVCPLRPIERRGRADGCTEGHGMQHVGHLIQTCEELAEVGHVERHLRRRLQSQQLSRVHVRQSTQHVLPLLHPSLRDVQTREQTVIGLHRPPADKGVEYERHHPRVPPLFRGEQCPEPHHAAQGGPLVEPDRVATLAAGGRDLEMAEGEGDHLSHRACLHRVMGAPPNRSVRRSRHDNHGRQSHGEHKGTTVRPLTLWRLQCGNSAAVVDGPLAQLTEAPLGTGQPETNAAGVECVGDVPTALGHNPHSELGRGVLQTEPCASTGGATGLVLTVLLWELSQETNEEVKVVCLATLHVRKDHP